MDENKPDPREDEEIENAVPAKVEQNWKHSFYDKIPVTVKMLDVIIKVLLALLAVALALGIYFGNFA